MVDDSIQYVLDNERFIKILNETIEASIRDRLGEVEEDVLHEVRDYIMERVSLYRHSNCQILSSS
jgi:hypothetical protein